MEGVDVEFRNADGQIVHDKVWLIDFANPDANEFLAVNQFTVEEGHFNRRADVVVFINGIPLAVMELKNIADEQATIRKAFDQFQTYKAQIPSLFHSNALLVISDGHAGQAGNHHVGLGAVHDVAHGHRTRTWSRRVRCNWKRCSKAYSTSRGCWIWFATSSSSRTTGKRY